MTEDKKELDLDKVGMTKDLTDDDIEEMLNNSPYSKGMDAGMKCKSSYNEGVWECPYDDEHGKDGWISGFEQGYAIKSLR
jgi:ribosome modulation factor